jgi:hypothetical protein
MNAFLETIQSLLSGVAPTKDTWISLLGTLSKTIGGILVGKGVVTADSWTALAGPEAVSVYAGIAMVLTPVVRDLFKHSLKGQIKTAKALPSADKVEVAQTLSSTDKIEMAQTLHPADKVEIADTLSDSLKLRMVEAMPDIRSIVAKPTASDGVAAAVKDSSRPKVVSAPMAA